jgi:hypothetical protein
MKTFLSATVLTLLMVGGPHYAAPLENEQSLCDLVFAGGEKLLADGKLEGVERAIVMLRTIFPTDPQCRTYADKLQKQLDDIRKHRELQEAPPKPAPVPAPEDGRIAPTRF